LPGDKLYKLIRNAGFEATTLWWGNKNHDDYEQHPQLARDAGLVIEHIHSPYTGANNLWLDNQSGEDEFQLQLSCVEACANHEIPTMVMHLSGGDAPPHYNELGLARIRRLVDLAERIGVNIALENLRKPPYLAYVLENIFSPRLGFCYDSGHHLLYAKSEDLLAKHGARIMAMHLHDNDGSADQHLLPFDGMVEWEVIMPALAKTKYAGAISLEVGNSGYTELSPEEFLQVAYERAQKLEYIMKKMEGNNAGHKTIT